MMAAGCLVGLYWGNLPGYSSWPRQPKSGTRAAGYCGAWGAHPPVPQGQWCNPVTEADGL